MAAFMAGDADGALGEDKDPEKVSQMVGQMMELMDGR